VFLAARQHAPGLAPEGLLTLYRDGKLDALIKSLGQNSGFNEAAIRGAFADLFDD
jgi:hypothetical protein